MAEDDTQNLSDDTTTTVSPPPNDDDDLLTHSPVRTTATPSTADVTAAAAAVVADPSVQSSSDAAATATTVLVSAVDESAVARPLESSGLVVRTKPMMTLSSSAPTTHSHRSAVSARASSEHSSSSHETGTINPTRHLHGPQKYHSYHLPHPTTDSSSLSLSLPWMGGPMEASKWVFVMVGLPARGKTFIARKISSYLRWLGVNIRSFNIGNYRRDGATQTLGKASADFFDPSNIEAQRQREMFAMLALRDLALFLLKGGQVAILDGTNSTRARRRLIATFFRRLSESTAEQGSEIGPTSSSSTSTSSTKRIGGGIGSSVKKHLNVRVVYVVSECRDERIIEQNIRNVKLRSPDYAHVPAQEAIADFKKRIAHYERRYERVTDEDGSYIKLVDAGKHVVGHQVTGYLPSRIMYYLMHLNLQRKSLFFTRHGESEDNLLGKIGGDSNLSKAGQKYAHTLADWMSLQPEFLSGVSGGAPIATTSAVSTGVSRVRTQHESAESESSSSNSDNDDDSNSSSDYSDAQLESAPVISSHDTGIPMQVWCSTLKRTIQTGEPLTRKHCTVLQWRALCEIDAGICDGLTYAQIESKWPDEFIARKRNKFGYRYPQGESYRDLIQRLEPVIFELERSQYPVLVIAHRAVLRCLLAYFTDEWQKNIPRIEVRLHTLYKLTPGDYGTDLIALPFDIVAGKSNVHSSHSK